MNKIRRRALQLLKPKRSGVRLSPAGRRYDLRRDLPDRRDMRFKTVVPSFGDVPKIVDLRDQCPPVYDQGSIGSCTGQAWAFMNDFVQLQELYEQVPGPREYDKSTFYNTSRLHIYYCEREIMGTPMEDSGAFLRVGAQALATYGACREKLWPYEVSKVFSRPSDEAVHEAFEHKAQVYMRLDSTADRMRCLADGYPFVFGFTVFDSFESPEVARSGVLSMPATNEANLGGHAVACVGYDQAKRVWIIRNSWGVSWGQEGYFEMPFEYMSDDGLACDFWTLRK